MSALTGYLALGTVDAGGAFTEAAFSTYARQAIAFDLDVPTAGGAIDTGGNVIRNHAAVSFAAPSALDWPKVNALAVFAASTGGAAQIIVPLSTASGIHARGAARTFAAGSLQFLIAPDGLQSPFGTKVVTSGTPVLASGALAFGNVGGASLAAASLAGDKVSLSGTGARASGTITIYKNGTPLTDAVAANGAGAWTYTLGSAASSGDTITWTDGVAVSAALVA